MGIRNKFQVLITSLILVPILFGGCKDSSIPLSPAVTTEVPTEVLPEVPTPQTVPLSGYGNSEFGFNVKLPASWDGFSVINSNWEGLRNGDQGDMVVEQGPLIRIVHPDATEEKPRQDIPIMVMTIEQWDHMQAGEWHIGAAPIGPSELGRNSLYVFGLPARYNYAFPEGWEEVEQILQDHSLEPFEPGRVP